MLLKEMTWGIQYALPFVMVRVLFSFLSFALFFLIGTILVFCPKPGNWLMDYCVARMNAKTQFQQLGKFFEKWLEQIREIQRR